MSTRHRGITAWRGCGVAILAASLLLGACTTNPTTGRSQFNALSVEDEIRLGTQAKPEMIREMGGEVAKAELRQYVTDVGMRLVATTAQDDPSLMQLPWEFTLLNSDVINAFALPGGKVFMSRGLAQRMTNEAQFAAVIGHEIGHVTARHVNDRYARAMGSALGLGLGSLLLGVDLSGLDNVVQIAMMSYDREQELESDALGVRYMVRAGYNPLGAKQVQEILKAAGGGRQPEWMSTHPDPGNRIGRIEALIREQYSQTQNNPAFTLGEQEFRSRFLSKLSLAYPQGSPDDPADTLLAMRAPNHWVGSCGASCAEHSR